MMYDRIRTHEAPVEIHTRVRARTAGDVIGVLSTPGPRTLVTCYARDLDDREIDGIGMFVEASRYEGGEQFARLTVDVGVTMPTRPLGRAADGPLEEAWEQRSYAGDCPLQAVAAVISCHECTPDGCIAFGTRQCYAKKRRREWDYSDEEVFWTDPNDDEGAFRLDPADDEFDGEIDF